MRRLPLILLPAYSLGLAFAAAGPASATQPGHDGAIAFIRQGNVYTAAADGSGQRRLTSGGGAGHPKWSPDGRRIAYERGGYIWTMNANGTDAVRRWKGAAVSWSPSGAKLSYVGPNVDDVCYGGPGVAVRALSGGKPQLLDLDDGACSGGEVGGKTYAGATTSWSWDGKHVLYSYSWHGGPDNPGDYSTIGGFDLSVPDQSGGWPPTGQSVIADFKLGVTPEVDYAPRGDNFVFASNVLSSDGRTRAYVWNRSGTYKRKVSGDTYVYWPVFSPNDRYVLYTQDTPTAAPRIRRVALGDSARAPVTVLTDASQADWQPLP